jgi:hypothetical protein
VNLNIVQKQLQKGPGPSKERLPPEAQPSDFELVSLQLSEHDSLLVKEADAWVLRVEKEL